MVDKVKLGALPLFGFAVSISLSATAAVATGWQDCTMLWSEVEANREVVKSVPVAVRYHETARVMKFEKIKLEAHVQETNHQMIDESTQVRLALWQEGNGYRMSYVWQDMNNGQEYDLYGRTWFSPRVVWQAHFFGGTLSCD